VSRPLFDLGGGAEVRVLEPVDAAAVFALVDSERGRLREWMPWVDGATTPASTREFIERSRSSQDDLEALGIRLDGVYAGGIGLRVDGFRWDSEIGYWIGSAWEGRGLVTRACRALIGHAFTEIGVHRVTIRAAPRNRRSRAIPERLGFTQEGVLREAGKTSVGYEDLVVYGLLEKEWHPS